MIINDLQWKIGGEAGFGIMTTGQIFSLVCSRGGLKTFAYPEYPSLIRGGHNSFQIVVNENSATSQRQKVNLLVALNKETVALHLNELASDAAVIFDPRDFKENQSDLPNDVIPVAVEFSKIIQEHKGKPVERNTIALGASFGLLNFPFEIFERVMRDWFGEKKPQLVQSNIMFAKAGYDAVYKKYPQFTYQLQPQTNPTPQIVLSGNTAICLGALAAGLKFYAAYPMTPSSGILSYLAEKEKKMNIVVKHTEDEISAINAIVGAGYAGVRAMTATSGGGFSLMVEALGMAGMAEVPIVIVMGQRPGPSTGLPTWGSQADLRFMLHASQGEFPRIVLTPGDIEECFYTTFEAFNLAEIYQLPVIILVDKYVQESLQSVPVFDTTKLKIERGNILNHTDLDALIKNGQRYLRYEHTPSGISPRVFPGQVGGEHVASSYEHNETGATTEDEQETQKQNDKRFQKLHTFLNDHFKAPTFYGPENAEITLVGWGSTKLTALETIRLAEKEGLSVNYLHFVYVYPLPVKEVGAAFAKTRKTLCIEGNKTGQLEGWIYQNTGIKMTANFHKYGGRPFYPEEIVNEIKKLS